MSSESPSLDRIAAEAAEWFMAIRMGGLSPGERLRFANWLEGSPLHVQEYLGVAEAWGALSSAQAWPEASADELIEAARGASNVVMLTRVPGPHPEPMRPAPKRISRFKRGIAAILSFVLLGTTLYGSVLFARYESHVYATARGEQRTINLEDGSVVQLNAMSRMVVAFTAGERRIKLKDGEAFFRVAHDTKRPFYVETPFATVRAVGTKFDVYSRGDGLRVAVVEGRVQVAALDKEHEPGQSAPAAPAELLVGASESVAMHAKGPLVRDDGHSTADATAWLQHRLVFENEPLADVIAEFNRYTTGQMRVMSSALATLRISGTFDAEEPETLAEYLEQVQHVKVLRRGSVTYFTSRQDGGTKP